MYNRTVLIGHVARKPELKQSDKGTAYCKFSVATNRGYGDKKSTQWNDIVAFGKQAENCCTYLDKGSVCCVEGSLVIETFTDKNGTKRKSAAIHASYVTFISSKNREKSDTEQMQSIAPDYSDQEPDEVEEDEIPF